MKPKIECTKQQIGCRYKTFVKWKLWRLSIFQKRFIPLEK